MHYDRWRGQWVGQAVSSSDATTIPTDAAAGASDITAANYQQALNSISASPSMNPTTAPSTTTLVVGGLLAIGLLWFLVKK